MKVSIIVLNYNAKEFLSACLASVLRADLTDFEVIVVDNGSTDGSLPKAEKQFSDDRRIHFLRSGENLGFSRGNNLGAKKADGELLVFLNPDTVVAPHWLEVLLGKFAGDETAGICQPLLLHMDKKTINCSGGQMDFFGFGTMRDFGRPVEEVKLKEEEIFYASGAALAVRKEVFDRLGGFDEEMFLYNEDLDFCWRAHLLGYRIFMVPASVVYHFHAGCRTPLDDPEIIFRKQNNQISAVIKNHGWFNLIWVLPFLSLTFFLEAVYFWLVGQEGKAKAFLKSLVWGFKNGRCLLDRRRSVQKKRIVSDSTFSRLFFRGSVPLKLLWEWEGERRWGRSNRGK